VAVAAVVGLPGGRRLTPSSSLLGECQRTHDPAILTRLQQFAAADTARIKRVCTDAGISGA
jgi:hypothetical protein